MEYFPNPLETFILRASKLGHMTEDDPFGLKAEPEQDSKDDLIENQEQLKISHIPDKLKYRQDEINEIVQSLFKHALKGHEGEDLVITGRPGTGKTAAVKYTKNKVFDHYDTSDMDVAYINCKTNNSKQEVFKAIMQSMEIPYKRGVGVGENVSKLLEKYKDPEDNSLVIILDEIDELYKARRDYINDVLYILSRPDEHTDAFRFRGNINLICVSNDKKLYDYLEFDVDDSSFNPERLEFLTYNVDEITDILMGRQETAYKDKVLDEEYMKEIAEVVYERFNGDIRVGIRILKRIPKILEDSDMSEGKLVRKAVNDVKRGRIEKVLNGKDDHFLLTMSATIQNFKKDKSKLKYIVDSYREACEKAALEKNGSDFDVDTDESRAKSRSYVRRKLEYLVDENILSKEKRYDKPRNPYFYKPEVDVDLFEELVNERLERSGLTSRLKEIESYEKQELRDEASEKLDQMVSG